MIDLLLSLAFVVGGVALVALALLDIFHTTLTLCGAGPVTKRITGGAWRVVRRLLAPPRALLYGGAAMAVVTVLTWLALLWAGWTLIFLASPGAVVEASTGAEADLAARIYFSGFTLFTLGLGDYRPQGGLWQILTAIAVGNGFLVISLSAAYLVPLLSAAAQKRALALTIGALGESPADIVVTAWTGRDLAPLRVQLVDLTSRIALVGQQHRAYPVLVRFDGPVARSALSVQIARLDEALLLMECALAPDVRPPTSVLRPVRNALDAYFEAVDLAGGMPAAEAPPVAGTDALAAAGIPLAPSARYHAGVAGAVDRRRIARGILEESGWDWRALA
ncbi:MAG: ion channel [Salinarimonas sp.]